MKLNFLKNLKSYLYLHYKWNKIYKIKKMIIMNKNYFINKYNSYSKNFNTLKNNYTKLKIKLILLK